MNRLSFVREWIFDDGDRFLRKLFPTTTPLNNSNYRLAQWPERREVLVRSWLSELIWFSHRQTSRIGQLYFESCLTGEYWRENKSALACECAEAGRIRNEPRPPVAPATGPDGTRKMLEINICFTNFNESLKLTKAFYLRKLFRPKTDIFDHFEKTF